MLPDADDFPAFAAEPAGDALIAAHVVFALFVPELPVGFGAGVALGAAVPKAPIDEDSDPKLGKGKIWFTRTIEMPSPASYVSSSHQAQKHELS